MKGFALTRQVVGMVLCRSGLLRALSFRADSGDKRSLVLLWLLLSLLAALGARVGPSVRWKTPTGEEGGKGRKHESRRAFDAKAGWQVLRGTCIQKRRGTVVLPAAALGPGGAGVYTVVAVSVLWPLLVAPVVRFALLSCACCASPCFPACCQRWLSSSRPSCPSCWRGRGSTPRSRASSRRRA